MEKHDLYDKYCLDFNQNFYTYTKEELENFKTKLTAEQIEDMKAMVDEIFTYEVQSVTFDRPAFMGDLDKHQYFSLSSYFYPDPEDASKPWVRNDGHVNPESIKYAKRGLRKTSMVINLASLMYYLTGEQKYHDVLVQHLNSWFINDETKMLPNLEYSQLVVNHPQFGKGRGFGVMDFSSNVGYGFVLLKHLYDTGLLEADIYQPLQSWVKELLVWLETSEKGVEERNASNNHGTIYALLVTQLHFFVGDLAEYKDELVNLVNGHLEQIEEDGSMPEELFRTRALAYSVMNLKAYLDTYKLLGVKFGEIPELRKAFEFLMPVLSNEIGIEDITVSHGGKTKTCEQMEGTYPEYFKLYLKHLAKEFGLDLKVTADDNVHYKYLFI